MSITPVVNLVPIRASDVDSVTASLPNNVVAGDFLVVTICTWCELFNTTVDVTKNSGSASLGTMTTLTSPTGRFYAGGFGQCHISYGFVTGPGSLEILVNPEEASGNYIAGGTILFSGIHATPLDVDNGELITGTTDTPTDTLDTITDNDLIIGVLLSPGLPANSLTLGSDYSQIDEEEDPSVQAFNAQYRIVTTPGTYNVDWAVTTANSYDIYSVAFKEATTPPPGPGPIPARRLQSAMRW